MSLHPQPDSEFERQGVTFKIITTDMYPQVADFMWTHFFPDEPIGRSCGMTTPSWLINQTYILDSIRKAGGLFCF